MTQPNNPQMLPPRPQRWSPQDFAEAVANYTRAAVSIAISVVLGAAALAGGYVALKAIWLFSQSILQTLGID